jgi:hypothetical protein
MTESDLKKVLKKKNYGVQSAFAKPSVKSGFASQKALVKAGGEGSLSNVERGVGLKSVRPEDLAIPYSGQCIVRIKVYRRRLTDPGSDCWKYHLDTLRYLGLLADDNDAAIRIEEAPHVKVESNEEERVELEIEYPSIDINDLCNYYVNGPKNVKTSEG